MEEPTATDPEEARRPRPTRPARVLALAPGVAVEDLRAPGAADRAPAPLGPAAAEAYFAASARGADGRAALEALVGAAEEAARDRFTQLAKESRGAWVVLLRARRGEALVVGNALTGAVVPLARAGFRVSLLDPSPVRLALALRLVEERALGRVRGWCGGEDATLPFEDGAFALVLREEEHDRDAGARGPSAAELRRVCGGELVLLADNRLGYKRSSGRYADLRLRGPRDVARSLLAPAAGERTLAGHRRRLAGPGFAAARAFALYPDRRDYSQVAALDAPLPRLQLGPKERANRAKTAAQRLGLVPLLAPSFALVQARAALAAAPTRIERALAALRERLGEPAGGPPPAAEHLVATRGNTAVVHTAVPGGDEGDPAGRWTLHLPLHPPHAPALALHLETLRRVAAHHPGVPVPEALFLGAAGGVELSCERRLPGVAAHHVLRGPADAERLLARAAAHLARLVERPARPLAEEELERLVDARLERVLARLDEPAARAALRRSVADARERLTGRAVPLVLRHGDLRPKHVQVDAGWALRGYVDWGTATRADLPLYDLAHLLAHCRKQLEGTNEGHAWRRVVEREGLRPGERAALDTYEAALGLDPEAARGLALLYPLQVAEIAVTRWPHGRPGWFEAHFGPFAGG